ncbi:hypothetical protein [Actinomadura atramentaria]|uniref:hypothetical protein n=1 Tax=Actinomadura atramentaria TaxID=1990 RepID=UPI00035FC61D|nr:hypothetical protein [Actinomadura atramentaria]
MFSGPSAAASQPSSGADRATGAARSRPSVPPAASSAAPTAADIALKNIAWTITAGSRYWA